MKKQLTQSWYNLNFGKKKIFSQLQLASYLYYLCQWNSIWNAKICVRFKLMLWKIAWYILSTEANQAAHIQWIEKPCILCNHESETAFHLFTQCPFTQSIWLSSSWSIHLINRLPISKYLAKPLSWRGPFVLAFCSLFLWPILCYLETSSIKAPPSALLSPPHHSS